MSKYLLPLLLFAASAFGQELPSTSYTRELLRAIDAAAARTALGLSGTNVGLMVTPQTSQFTTNGGVLAISDSAAVSNLVHYGMLTLGGATPYLDFGGGLISFDPNGYAFAQRFYSTTPQMLDANQLVWREWVLTNGTILPSLAYTNVVYVRTNGNNATAQRGNPNKPWATFGLAVSNAVAGDTVSVGPGVYYEPTQVWMPEHVAVIGEPGNRIDFGANLSGGALDGALTVINDNQFYNLSLNLTNGYAWILVGDPEGSDRPGTNVLFKGCTIQGRSDNFMLLWGLADTSVPYSLTVDNCDLTSGWDFVADLYWETTNGTLKVVNSRLTGDTSRQRGPDFVPNGQLNVLHNLADHPGGSLEWSDISATVLKGASDVSMIRGFPAGANNLVVLKNISFDVQDTPASVSTPATFLEGWNANPGKALNMQNVSWRTGGVWQAISSGLVTAERIAGNGSEITNTPDWKITIASSTSPAWQKLAANYVCTGTNDQTVFNAAIASFPSAGGTIQMTDGEYYLTGPIIVDKMGMTLRGTGRIDRGGDTGPVGPSMLRTVVSTNAILLGYTSGAPGNCDFCILEQFNLWGYAASAGSDPNSIGILCTNQSGDDFLVRDLYVRQFYTAVKIRGFVTNPQLLENWIEGNNYGIDVDAAVGDGTVGTIALRVVNSVLYNNTNGMVLKNCTAGTVQFLGNGMSVAADKSLVTISNSSKIIIANNYLAVSGSAPLINCVGPSNVLNVVVVGNVCSGSGSLLSLTNGDYCVNSGNSYIGGSANWLWQIDGSSQNGYGACFGNAGATAQAFSYLPDKFYMLQTYTNGTLRSMGSSYFNGQAWFTNTPVVVGGTATLQLGNGASSQNATLAFSSGGDNSLTIATKYTAGTANYVAVAPANVETVRFRQGSAIMAATNAVSGWPTLAATPGGFAVVNSNGFPWMLLSGPNSTAWTATNKLGW